MFSSGIEPAYHKPVSPPLGVRRRTRRRGQKIRLSSPLPGHLIFVLGEFGVSFREREIMVADLFIGSPLCLLLAVAGALSVMRCFVRVRDHTQP